MRIITFLFILTVLSSSCSDDLLDLDLSERELEIINECKSESIIVLEELASSMVGNWKLHGVSCSGLCHPEREIQRERLELRSDKTGTNHSENISHELTWDIVVRPDGSLQLDLEPSISTFEDITIFCANYMVLEVPDVTIIYRKD